MSTSRDDFSDLETIQVYNSQQYYVMVRYTVMTSFL